MRRLALLLPLLGTVTWAQTAATRGPAAPTAVSRLLQTLREETTPDQAGLGFCVKVDKPGGFVGLEALLEARETGLSRRLRCLALDDPRAVVLGNEPVRLPWSGEVVSRVRSGGYGWSVGQSLAYAYLPIGLADVGTPLVVDVFGVRVGAVVVKDPVFDPRSARVHA